MSDLKRWVPRGAAGAAAARGAPVAAFVDEQSGVRIEAHRPLDRPDLWRAYLDGAEARYRQHDLAHVLKRPELEDGRTTSLFYVAIDDDRVVAGIRCHGPLHAPSEAQALRELDGHPRLSMVGDRLAECVPEGLVEIKGAWVDPDFPRRGLSDAMARCHVHAMTWFGVRFAMCTCSDTTAPRWESTGGRAMPDLAPVPFPDDRYRTLLLWWDRELVEHLSDADQWRRIADERRQLAGPAAPTEAWQPEILDDRRPDDAVRLAELMGDPDIEILDRLGEQLAALGKVRPPMEPDPEGDAPRWVHYPWRRSLVRLLGPTSFRALRLDRNRNKITRDEQERLARLRVGVVGLSVGHTIAYVLALEGICGELRLADFDTIELSNLNRIPATVFDLGLNKAVVVSRRIAELDPYIRLDLFPDGLTAGNVGRFIDGLDVVVEECDSLDLKAMVRAAARQARIPVLMETSDRGLLDVERFDLEPDRPLFHGLLGDVEPADLVGLSTHDKVPHVLRILEPDQLSSRMAASMAEIDETLTTWPQLGGDVTLGGATIAAAVRRLGLGDDLPSGRVRVDLDAILDDLTQPERPATPCEAPVVPAPPPDDPALAVAHAANLAPSGGNSQPWSLRLDDRRLRLLLDRSRTSMMDVHFRGSYVAIGAALLNARIAAAAHGILGPVACFPDGEASDLVAELSFGAATDADLAQSYAWVLDRSTNRHAGVPSDIDPAVVDELHRQVEGEGARLHLVTSEDGLEGYADLLGESDRLRYLSPRLHAEMMSELRWAGDESPDTGIDVRTLGLDEADLAKLAVARRADVMADLAAWDGGRALGEVTRERVRSSSALAVVTVPDARPRSYVAGGAGVQRLWLAANAAGLAVQPVSPLSVFAVEPADFAELVPEPYILRLQSLTSRLRALAGLADGETIALVVRLSHVAELANRSLRIPLETALLGDVAAAQ
ncbi:MAG: Rv1355c family protein [Acidimicrobiales bacterium]|nr:Rv1355c family protein [Acidimicrobiales bacterium]